VDNPPGLLEGSLHLGSGSFHGLLAEVYALGQQMAAFLNRAGVGAVLELDAFGLEIARNVSEEFVFIDSIHRQGGYDAILITT
jgi:hypothetical protein